MNLAVVGSRDFADYTRMALVLSEWLTLHPELCIVSGGARGADALAARFARDCNVPLTVFEADWSAHGRSAGPKRNSQIVEAADALVAFWDGVSAGTGDSVRKAQAKGIPVTVIHLPRPASDA